MSSFAKFQMRSAVLMSAAYAMFAVLMLDGPTLGQRSANQMTLIIVGLFIGLAIAFALLWSRSMHQDGGRTRADEREEQIEAAAERTGYRFLDAAIFGLMLLALSDAKWGWLGSFALTRPEGLVFALVTASAVAGIGRFLTGYIAARQR